MAEKVMIRAMTVSGTMMTMEDGMKAIIVVVMVTTAEAGTVIVVTAAEAGTVIVVTMAEAGTVIVVTMAEAGTVIVVTMAEAGTVIVVMAMAEAGTADKVLYYHGYYGTIHCTWIKTIII